MSVTKDLSATTKSVLDQIRMVIIWAVFLLPWGSQLCRVQDYFHWIEVTIRSILNKALNTDWLRYIDI